MIKAIQSKKLKITLIIIFVSIVLLTIILVFNNMNCNSVKNAIVGKSFRGVCVGFSSKHTYLIEIIDENTLRYSARCEFDYFGKEHDFNTSDTVNYELQSDILGRIKLIINDATFKDSFACPVEPFYLKNEGDEFFLYTNNYSSRMELCLYER